MQKCAVNVLNWLWAYIERKTFKKIFKRFLQSCSMFLCGKSYKIIAILCEKYEKLVDVRGMLANQMTFPKLTDVFPLKLFDVVDWQNKIQRGTRWELKSSIYLTNILLCEICLSTWSRSIVCKQRCWIGMDQICYCLQFCTGDSVFTNKCLCVLAQCG